MSVLTRPVSLQPTGAALGRLIQAKAYAIDDYGTALMRAETWRDMPHVLEGLRLSMKASVPAGSTSDATWAGPLSQAGLASEALTFMRHQTIVGALEDRMQKVPPSITVPVETDNAGMGDWVAENVPIPAARLAFTSVIQALYKIGAITALSAELVKSSTPGAQPTVTRIVLGRLGKSIDYKFLDPTVTAVANTRPASITNGSTEIVSTGNTAAAIAADLASMLAAMTTPGPYTWILRPTTTYRIALVLGSQAVGLPQTLLGIPVIASANSPAQITLVDPAALLFSDAGQFEVDVSRNATVAMDDAPEAPETIVTSFFQANLLGIRAMRWLAWLRPLSGSVSYMTTSY